MIPQKIIDEWLSDPFDQETQNLVKKLMKYPEKLEDAFYTSLNFGTGGIRGIMGVGTNRINKYTLGKSTQGLSRFLKKKYPKEQLKVVIAFDCRHQSQSLAKIVADVFTANGIYCYLFSELRPTPELSFAVRHLKTHCGIVLTASHNPPEYNGYKVYGKDGGQLVPPDDKSVINEIEKTTYKEILYAGNTNLLKYINHDLDDAYHQAVLEDAKIHDKDKSQLKIVFTSIHGTSITAIPQVLKKAGYKKVFIVKEQEKPDGDFPTVASPNPEEREALNLAVKLADQKKADIVIGTDPDADRFGLVVKDLNSDWYYLNGNQIMVVLTEFLLQKKAVQKKLHKNCFVASTIVSTPLIQKIAEYHGVQYKNTLTGFKWIAKLIEDFSDLEFIGGGEESFGYMVGDFVRDKDAVTAALLACELVTEAKSNGSSFFNVLLESYEKLGCFQERLVSLVKKGKSGAEEIERIMDRFRKDPPKNIDGSSIRFIEDYGAAVRTIVKTQEKEMIPLPKANVLIFIAEDGTRVAARPSGTEPKIKFYVSVNTNLNSTRDYRTTKDQLDQKIDRILAELGM